MAGHNKWSKIKHTKGKSDALRGKLFTKLGKVITVATKTGGADPQMNPALRDAILKARANNMPSDNIERSIKRGTGEGSGENYEQITYEGYGINGSAVIVECLTDNKNRTAGDVRHLFDKYGGSLGTNGSVKFMFEYKGVIAIENSPNFTSETLLEWLLETDIEDFIESPEGYEIHTSPLDFSKVKDYLATRQIEPVSAELEYLAQNYIVLEEDRLETFKKMLEKFEDNDDVQNIYHNVENTD